jgi:hypothetical protein
VQNLKIEKYFALRHCFYQTMWLRIQQTHWPRP